MLIGFHCSRFTFCNECANVQNFYQEMSHFSRKNVKFAMLKLNFSRLINKFYLF